MFESQGFSAQKCFEAADVQVSTIRARCACREDEAMLVEKISEEGGFDALDKIIENFRRDALPGMAVEGFVAKGELKLYEVNEDARKLPDVVMAAVRREGGALRHAHEDLKKDAEIVKAAVTQDGLALEYADEVLKKDPAVVSAAVTQNGLALEFARRALTKDPDIVKIAVKQNRHA